MGDTKTNVLTKKRITWVDIAKGICMFLVIMGHTVHAEGGKTLPLISRGVVMSFHMPLYFILSAYTFRPSENMEQFKRSAIRSAKRLLIPSLIIFVVRMVVYDRIIIENQVNLGYCIRKSLSLLMSSGVSTRYAGMDVPAFGMIWFLVVLFTARVIFDYIHMIYGDKYLFSICMLGSLAGVTLGKATTTFMCFDLTFTILPLLYFGYALRKVNFADKKAAAILKEAFICMAVWGGLLYITFPEPYRVTYLELASRNYPIYPLCFIIAILGTLMFCKFSCLIDRIPGVNTVLRFIGKNSLYLYMIHCVDKMWDKFWDFGDSQKLQVVMRCLTDAAVFAIFMILVWVVGKMIKKR